jgi:hypothetical protein
MTDIRIVNVAHETLVIPFSKFDKSYDGSDMEKALQEILKFARVNVNHYAIVAKPELQTVEITDLRGGERITEEQKSAA